MSALLVAGLYCALSVTWTIGTLASALLQPVRRRIDVAKTTRAISVIVPTSTIRSPRIDKERNDAIASLLDMDATSREILVCLDSSDSDNRLALDLEERFSPDGVRVLAAPARSGANAKIDAMETGLRHAVHDLVLFSDDDILVDRAHLSHLAAFHADGAMLVSSAAIGMDARNLAAHLECSLMNGQFARLHLAGDFLGFSGALGKTVMMARPGIGALGGLLPANTDCCEDAALTRMVKRSGGRVVLSDLVVRQPLGALRYRDVLRRHRRWLSCRRKYLPVVFLLEALFSTIPTAIAGSVVLDIVAGLPLLGLVLVAVLHCAADSLFAVAHRYFGRHTVAAWFVRELLFLPLWTAALVARTVIWHGKRVPVSGS